MNANFYIAKTPQSVETLTDFFVALIPGSETRTLRQFYEKIAAVLEFPDTFGYTMESLDDQLNDLDWIEDEKIALYVTDSELFVSQERDPGKLVSLLNMIEATCEDWKWLADEDLNGEEVLPKQLIVVFADSPRIRQFLEREEIEFGELA
jgi:hypothetical protein